VVEGARLESVYTPKGYLGFESQSLRQNQQKCPARGISCFKNLSKLFEQIRKNWKKNSEGICTFVDVEALFPGSRVKRVIPIQLESGRIYNHSQSGSGFD
jgi:hypothetical protein